MWIDSHCHLNHSGIDEKGKPSDIINAAHENGINGMITVCCSITDELDELLIITSQNDNTWCSIGTHPHDSGREDEKSFSADRIAENFNVNDKVVAIGETGLDYFYDNSPREDQKKSFEKHIDACIKASAPMIVHTRDAEEDTANILRSGLTKGNLRGVMHCFSSSQWLAEQALDMGFYISFSGMVTFKKSDDLREIAKSVPLDKVLIETDAPFLAPIPYRGKVNEPAYVKHTGEFLAELYGISTEKFAKITTDNFYRLFTKAKGA